MYSSIIIRSLLPACLLSLVWTSGVAAQSIQTNSGLDEVTIPNTSVQSFVSKINGTKYLIYVALPSTYERETEQRYPVAYFTDATDGFGLATDVYRTLRRSVPELIVIGIAYDTRNPRVFQAHRNLELTPTRMLEREKERTERYGIEVLTGGAEKFLAVFSEEIIPFVDERYRTTSDNTYVGVSLGGLFGFYALFNSNNLFKRYLLASPSLFWGKSIDESDPHWWDNGVMFVEEADYASKHKDLEAKVYMSVGSLESDYILPPTKKMASLLNSRSYPSFDFTFEILDQESHLSAIPFSYSKGLRALFQPE